MTVLDKQKLADAAIRKEMRDSAERRLEKNIVRIKKRY